MEVNLEKDEYLQDEVEYGGFWIRFAAYLMDSIIISIPLAILAILIFFTLFGTTGTYEILLSDNPDMTDEEALQFFGTYFAAMAITGLISLIVSVGYFAGLHASKWQATLGKKIVGLKVTDMNGNRITFWRSLGRYLAMSFLSGILMVGYIVAAFTEKKQSLHDLIASTVVVKK